MSRPKNTSQKLTDSEKKVIVGLAQNGLNRNRAAHELHYHFNSISYIVGRIRAKTGLDPLNFFDMIKLVEIVNGGDTNGN